MKKPVVFFCLFIIALFACSPKIQLGGMRAPANMIIDGLTTEWSGGKFAAYSPELRLYYTLCNDDNYLYLIVRAQDHISSNENLFCGGVKLSITPYLQIPAVGGEAPEKVTIVYPQLREERLVPLYNTMLKFDKEHYRIDSTSRMSRKQLDSILLSADQQMSGPENRVKITGIKGQTDSIFTVAQNPYNINAAARFDANSRLVCEIALPLTYLAQVTKPNNSFNYSLKLYGVKWMGRTPPILIQSKPLRYPPFANADMIWTLSAHVISGSYTLVK